MLFGHGRRRFVVAVQLRRHVDLCAAFRLPVLSFVDQPGFAVGVQAEMEAYVLGRPMPSSSSALTSDPSV